MLEFGSALTTRERHMSLQSPRSPFRCVDYAAGIMTRDLFAQIVSQTGIESIGLNLALKNIHIEKSDHADGAACRVVARHVRVHKLYPSAFAKATGRQSSLSC
jgi:hypothetical protein